MPLDDLPPIARQIADQLERISRAGVSHFPKAVDENEFAFLLEAPPQIEAPIIELDPLESRRIGLQMLADEVARCTLCPHLASTRTQTVFGVGPLNPDICFIAEAPGADEDRIGEPLVGAAGQMQMRIINACGYRREEVYLMNVLRCRPPGNRTPTTEEADNCRIHLGRQLELVQPKFICLLGATAAKLMISPSISINRARGKFYEYQGIPMMVTYHPASLLDGRSPENKKFVWEDMKMLLRKMGRPVPETKKKDEE